MKEFISDRFLLEDGLAAELYGCVKDLGAVDYHNHLDPASMATDRHYSNIARLWVISDPYKHRAMRMCGVPERLITGDADDFEKFLAWADVCPKTLGGPLFHWSALEMKRVFGIDEMLTSGNAREIWGFCNSRLGEGGLSCNDILNGFNAEYLCTSDDFRDDVSVHTDASGKGFKVCPSLRADSILTFPGEYPTLDEYLDFVQTRLDVFDESGCRLADHAIDGGFHYDEVSREKASCIYLDRKVADDGAISALKSYVLSWLIKEYAHRGWVLQLHIGAQRQTSSRLRALAGPAGGYASIGSCCDITSLCRLLDEAECHGALPRTILYTLNPADNAAFATLCGSFSAEDGMPKIQFGPAWWYNDHKYGMESHLEVISSYGLLSTFIGMTTDSRSFLSLSRHEYFRRILCSWIAEKVRKGEFPEDLDLLAGTVRGIAHDNARAWIFGK